ncbi:CrcB family protein [Saccharopolyspora sp. TS4A08]|uniref:Fluoride-specific ion channel FluC n=1 Tax=Saccharopolyspora ipomoeae TaxID=3042027 RepID=A0ABT6PU36_9PSEU|nr:CrcB family protein [Saccharopolyspora sp. TS4A08]MDI2031148.1 CrcB family protein [Saccharopolyspora sp. TS4A08]
MSSEPPVDADVGLGAPPQREWRDHPAAVLIAIAAGGALGALARHGLTTAFPTASGAVPWATLCINAGGCALIGVLMVLISDVWPGQRLLRPFIGVGFLSGYTTFSTYVVEIQRAIAVGAPHVALIYMALTVVVAMVAVLTGTILMRALLQAARRKAGRS